MSRGGMCSVIAVFGTLLAFTGYTAAEGSPSAAASTGRATTVEVPVSATLVLGVNPSPLAERTALANAGEIIRADGMPNMTVVGLYEEHGVDDGVPFDRAFLSTKSPHAHAPAVVVLSIHCSGTAYQKATCKHANAGKLAAAKKTVMTWKSNLAAAMSAWKENVRQTLAAISKSNQTEQVSLKGDWDLRGLLLKAGQTFEATATPRRCVALLGGLAVRMPPHDLNIELLAGSTIVVAGWIGTEKVQAAWKKMLAPFGTKIVFLPQAVTGLQLSEAIAGCLRGDRTSNE